VFSADFQKWIVRHSAQRRNNQASDELLLQPVASIFSQAQGKKMSALVLLLPDNPPYLEYNLIDTNRSMYIYN
jgi:hypothetical protein